MGQREPAALEGAIAVAPLAEQSLAFRELVLGSAGPFAEQLACTDKYEGIRLLATLKWL